MLFRSAGGRTGAVTAVDAISLHPNNAAPVWLGSISHAGEDCHGECIGGGFRFRDNDVGRESHRTGLHAFRGKNPVTEHGKRRFPDSVAEVLSRRRDRRDYSIP